MEQQQNNPLLSNEVETDEIYNTEPMYTFILTPSIIKEIRNYNKTGDNNYAKYTGSLDSKTFDYKCNEGTGRTCISDYLSYLIEITNAKNNPGVCVSDDTRTYNNPTSFENCRY